MTFTSPCGMTMDVITGVCLYEILKIDHWLFFQTAEVRVVKWDPDCLLKCAADQKKKIAPTEIKYAWFLDGVRMSISQSIRSKTFPLLEKVVSNLP